MNAETQAILSLEDVSYSYKTRELTRRGMERSELRAVDGVSLSVQRGETVGIVGESGCGKTTLGRLVLGLLKPSGGRVVIGSSDIATLRGKRKRQLRRSVQAVFQDPYGSLDPRMRVGSAIEEVVRSSDRSLSRRDVRARAYELLDDVGLDEGAFNSLPGQMSGGQRQRVGVAKAFATDPDLIVADEPVSALDVSVQAQILNLLMRMQAKTGVAYIIIAHGLPALGHVADRIGVLYLGKLVEIGPTADVLLRPGHHYTAALVESGLGLDSVGRRDQSFSVLTGEPASAREIPSGCRFRTRCPRAEEMCAKAEPPLAGTGSGHASACHFPLSTALHGSRT